MPDTYLRPQVAGAQCCRDVWRRWLRGSPTLYGCTPDYPNMTPLPSVLTFPNRMNPAEFDNIARAEQDFWWYRGMREILFRILDPVVTRGASALEAGCGTGHLSKALEQRYGWRMTPLDLGREGLEYAHGYGLRRLIQGDV